MHTGKLYIKIPLVLIALFVINFLGNQFHIRFDITESKRYTLSEASIDIIENVENPLYIKVYLQGDFPTEFKRIQLETKQFLEELAAINENIHFRFVNPNGNTKTLIKKGLHPSRLTVQEDGKVSEAVIFPWAVVKYNGKSENVSLLSNTSAKSQEEQLQISIENLEYNFIHTLFKISSEKTKKIAVLRGNGELEDIYLYSFLKDLGKFYKLAAFTLDSVQTNPQKTFNDISEYDLTIIAKPSQLFSEEEKITLDQYIIQGGKTLWLLDNVVAEMDSLMTNGEALAFNRDLGLTDLLFHYGLRINYNITKDVYSSKIRLASGNLGSKAQYQDFLWHYYPLIISNSNNPITTNLDPIVLKFPSTIDTLNNGISKTILLQSSPFAKIIGTPTAVKLEEITIQPKKEDYRDKNLIYGVLLEGDFTSAYAKRTKPFDFNNFKVKGLKNKMIVVSDGDIIANETFKGEPISLNKDKFTNQTYGNSDFLMNAVHYLLDDSGVLKLRSKQIKIHFLDKEKAYIERRFWQVFNIILPLSLLAVFGFIFNYVRKKRYSS